MSLFKSDKETKAVKPAVAEGTAAPAAPAPAAPKPAASHRPHYAVLDRPWLSEKALLGAARGQYVFKVEVGATKPAIRSEVERRYGVHVMDVNIVRLTGKQKHFRGILSHKMIQKKAVVTLKQGEKIDVQ